MHVRQVLLIGLILGLPTGLAQAQFRPMAMPAGGVVPMGGAASAISGIPAAMPQSFTQPRIDAHLAPVQTYTAPMAAHPQTATAVNVRAATGTIPEPPVVKENPPVIPYHRNDDKNPSDDPLWMHRQLERLKTTSDLPSKVEWTPPPPPPTDFTIPTPIVKPAEEAKPAESPASRWGVAVVMALCVVFWLGRASRS